MCFFEILSKYSKVLDFKKILDKARQYKILSYNMIYDIKRIFKSQQKDIDELNSDIERIPFTADCLEKFSSIYGKIIEQDWLFYNAEVRVHFLKKFGDFCERLHVWKLNFNGEKINPFDVRVKELAREKVAYLKSSDKKFISATLSDIMQTKYIKNIEDFNFNGNYSVDSFRRVKSSFLKSFYNYDILDGEENVFYGGKNNNKKIDSELLFESEKIPTFINLKLKLVENIVGLGNSDASVIKSMAQSLFGNEQNESQEQISNITEADIDFPAFKAEISQEFEDRIVYLISGREVVGYKMNQI